jgi:hypothetical protein
MAAIAVAGIAVVIIRIAIAAIADREPAIAVAAIVGAGGKAETGGEHEDCGAKARGHERLSRKDAWRKGKSARDGEPPMNVNLL